MNLKVDKRRVQTHFTYSWWKYLALIVTAVFGWNLIYTTTAYRSPAELKVDWYYEGYFSEDTSTKVNQLLREICDEIKPETEEVSFVQCGTDETYGAMQLTVWIAAGEGDLYTLKEDDFSSMGEAMLDLQPYIDSGELNVEGLNLKKGYYNNSETGEKILCGIPGENLKGLEEIGVSVDETVFCILANCGNEDTVVKVLNQLIEKFRTTEITE